MNISNRIIKNHKWFESKIEKILVYSNEINHNIPENRSIKPGEKKIILESLILRTCAIWESFLECEIVVCALEDQQKLKQQVYISKKIKLNQELIKAIIFSDRYRDFHDINRTKSVFKLFINDTDNPIIQISSEQKKAIDFIYTMRNYLSHYSSFSKQKLMDQYKKNFDLKKFKEPGEFLSTNKGENFTELISQFKYASINMKNHWKQGGKC